MDQKENKKYLVVGLGNPDPEFEKTLHNVGFGVLNEIIEDQKSNWKKTKAVSGEMAKVDIRGKEVILLKPLTYMNRSGLAVKNALNFWKISLNNLLIVQDDSDIEMGRLKIGYDQSSGGHKGLESIIQALGSQKFTRVKIGVRPSNLTQNGKTYVKAEKFILRPYPKDKLEPICQAGADAVCFWLENGLAKAMSEYNVRNF